MTEAVKADVRAVEKFNGKPMTYTETKAVIVYIQTLKEKGLWDIITILSVHGFKIK